MQYSFYNRIQNKIVNYSQRCFKFCSVCVLQILQSRAGVYHYNVLRSITVHNTPPTSSVLGSVPNRSIYNQHRADKRTHGLSSPRESCIEQIDTQKV